MCVKVISMNSNEVENVFIYMVLPLSLLFLLPLVDVKLFIYLVYLQT